MCRAGECECIKTEEGADFDIENIWEMYVTQTVESITNLIILPLAIFGNSNEYVVRKLTCVFEFSEFKKFFLTFLIYMILIG